MKKILAVVVVVVVGFCFFSTVTQAEDVRVPTAQTETSAYYEFLVPADIAQADETRIWVEPDKPRSYPHGILQNSGGGRGSECCLHRIHASNVF